jgi:hypothetical protein
VLDEAFSAISTENVHAKFPSKSSDNINIYEEGI